MQTIIVVGFVPDDMPFEQAEAIAVAGAVAVEAGGAQVQVCLAGLPERFGYDTQRRADLAAPLPQRNQE